MAIYSDISSYYGLIDDLPLLSEDDSAILNGFINLLNTIKDEDGISERPFRPNIGTTLMALLHDPIDNITAFKLKLEIVQLGMQMTRASIVGSETLVTPNFEEECYNLTIVLRNSITGELIKGFFNMNKA